MKPRDSDLIRQVEHGLDNERRHPVKELGIPDYREDDEQESRKRDDGWEDLRDKRRNRRESGHPGTFRLSALTIGNKRLELVSGQLIVKPGRRGPSTWDAYGLADGIHHGEIKAGPDDVIMDGDDLEFRGRAFVTYDARASGGRDATSVQVVGTGKLERGPRSPSV